MAGNKFVYPPPRDGKPFRLVMGLRSLLDEQWIEVGPELDSQLRERQDLISTQPENVFGALAGYDEPAAQFAEMLISNLDQFHQTTHQVISPNQVRHLGTGLTVDIRASHPFLELAKIIGEDLCLISKVDGEWVLTAAAVIFPSRWRLSEKLGKNLDQIHAPVPGYESTLQPAMSLTFDKLTAERKVWRLNWALHPDSELHQPTAVSKRASPAEYWWRTERQTLAKLPQGEHVLFTIRNRAEPLSQILANPDHAAAFAQTLDSMSPETISYKGLTQDHRVIVDYLVSRNIR